MLAAAAGSARAEPRTAPSTPDIAVSPGSLTFGIQCIDATSPTQLVAVSNTGTTNLTVTAVANSNPTDFQLSGTPPLPSTVASGGSFSFGATFDPETPGPRAGTITITSDDPDEGSVAVSLSGRAVPGQEVSVTPGSVAFGDRCIGTTSGKEPITVSNTGTATLTVSAITNSNPTDFQLSGIPSLPRILAPGGSFSFQVAFHPETPGPKAGTIAITSNDPDEATTMVPLRGRSAVQDIAVRPKPLAFGKQPVPTTSRARKVTVSNTSDTCALRVTDIMVGGSDEESFVLGRLPSLPTGVAPGDSFSFKVRFRPSERSSASADLVVMSDDPDEPTVEIRLKGRGVRAV